MSLVYNWQINRKMEYPHAEHHPQRQFAFVFNLNRCIGCQTCTMACKSTWTFAKGQEYMWWNNVETKPYGGYPQSWDVRLLEMLDEADASGKRRWNGATFEGLTIFEAAQKKTGDASQRVLGYLPTDEEWRFPNIYEDSPLGPEGRRGDFHKEGVDLPEHKTWFFYLARICNHCTYPACLAACPRNAIYKRPEDGVVLVDQQRCRGYRKCVEACPYKKAMYRPSTRVTEKCIACYPRLEGNDPETKGKPMETRCMASCIGQIRLQGLVETKTDGGWVEDRYNPLYYLVKVAKVALPLYPQFGTEPNGYYIPPRWVPRAFLKQMFGPGVDHAIDSYMVPDRELLAVQQLFRRSNRIIFRYKIEEGPKVFTTEIHGKPFTLYNDTIIAYDKTGEEIVRTQVEEPFYVRPDKHQNSI